ncbi:energy-coupling factor transport system substrate-specific component [Propionibacterium cyclohexanicum]|uniref:Energy-coupling factor transport system substrate-specific component n=1 Tax=Propionibacterium cyclohexanicum TaxID=64702 RepID=A0A1H9RU34_9ACTN|nr:ECF transporter S component [Propionibacterium cyclohexanicum]SER76312.1 energy-coupling factor transport system substrate-specific component [Propionibacterium cyclohexanicum]
MSSKTPSAIDETRPVQLGAHHWRVVDIVVGAVLAVAVGLIFWAWNTIGSAWYSAMAALTPGLGGIASGIWFLGGPLGALVIRKPGAAVFVETLAAVVSMVIGNQWGITTVTSGFFQGLGAEIVFLIVRYRMWTVPVAIVAGAAAGFGAWANELFIGQTPNITMGLAFNVIYLVSNLVSGAVLAGLLGWIVTKALAKTGALNRFASGRQA